MEPRLVSRPRPPAAATVAAGGGWTGASMKSKKSPHKRLFAQGEQLGETLIDAAGQGPTALMAAALSGLAAVVALLLRHQTKIEEAMLAGELVPRKVDEALDRIDRRLGDVDNRLTAIEGQGR